MMLNSARRASVRTKIVATIGPATASPAMLERLIRAGMDVARLNLSYGSLAEHAQTVSDIRKVADRLEATVAVLLDLPGPKYRIGKLKGGKVTLRRGAEVTLTQSTKPGDASTLPVTLPELARGVRRGQAVLLDDGALRLRVLAVEGDDVRCRVVVGGVLKEGKGLVAPGMKTTLPFVADALLGLVSFAVEQRADYVALSFVGERADVEQVRAEIRRLGSDIPIIAKIERPEAVRSFDGILAASDAVMVARGDLGVQLPLERVPLLQKEIIRKCNRAGKPVITATEMLESMIGSPRPTRAETTDVANAIFDGTDAVMLSGETSIGQYPVQSVAMMQRIARQTEPRLPYEHALLDKNSWVAAKTEELIAYNACRTAQSLRAKAIVAMTLSGSTAGRVSRYRPPTPVVAITPEDVCRRLVLYWGVRPVRAEAPATLADILRIATAVCRELGLVRTGDLIVVTGGIPIGVRGSTNLLKVERIS